MRLCMFHPRDRPMERGWVGRLDGDRVAHLAAQTIQHFFAGGAGAREHAEYAVTEVAFLAPVLHPPSVRVFDARGSFEFANPAAVRQPGEAIAHPDDGVAGTVLTRLAAVVGAEGAIGGFTGALDVRAPSLPPPKDRDFALVLGPLVVTPDVVDPGGVEGDVAVGDRVLPVAGGGFDWEAARLLAAAGTLLRPGDLLLGPPLALAADVSPGAEVELILEPFGRLAVSIA